MIFYFGKFPLPSILLLLPCPTAATPSLNIHVSSQIFFIAYGQNPEKNGQNGCFLKKL